MAATQRRQNRAQSRPVRKVTPPRLPQHGRWTKGQGHAEAGSEDGIPAEGRAGVEADQGGNVTPGKGRHGRERKNGKGHAEARARQRGHGQRRTRLATETPRARIQGKGRAYAEENLWPSQAHDAPIPSQALGGCRRAREGVAAVRKRECPGVATPARGAPLDERQAADIPAGPAERLRTGGSTAVHITPSHEGTGNAATRPPAR